MKALCCKVEIPGKTIGRDSTFYFFNIEGFFDIEKGVYLSLLRLLNALAILIECDIKIVSYAQMAKYLNILSSVLSFATKIARSKINQKIEKEESEKNNSKDDNNLLENKKDYLNSRRELNNIEKKKTLNKTYSFNSINRKERNSKNIINHKNKNLINNYVNNSNNRKLKRSFSTRNLKEENKSENKEAFNKIINFFKKNKLIKNFIDMPIIEKIGCFSYGLDLVKSIISCQDLVSYIQTSFTLINNGINIAIGIRDFAKGIKQNDIGLIILGSLNIITNGIDISFTLINQIKKTTEIKLTKSQKNFKALISQMTKMFCELINKNLSDLYDNNIIVMAIDEKKTIFNSNEGVDLRIINIEELNEYAKCLDHNDVKREKYLQNMILFHHKIIGEINILKIVEQYEDKKDENQKESKKRHLSDIKKAITLLLNTQNEITTNNKYNNENFWINATGSCLDEIIKSSLKLCDENND